MPTPKPRPLWRVMLASTTTDKLVDIYTIQALNLGLACAAARRKLNAHRILHPQRHAWDVWFVIPTNLPTLPKHALAWGTSEGTRHREDLAGTGSRRGRTV